METTSKLTDYQRHLIRWAAKNARSKTQTWPGFPLSHLPVIAKSDLRLLLDAGLLRLVEVTKPCPDGAVRTYTYVATAKKKE